MDKERLISGSRSQFQNFLGRDWLIQPGSAVHSGMVARSGVMLQEYDSHCLACGGGGAGEAWKPVEGQQSSMCPLLGGVGMRWARALVAWCVVGYCSSSSRLMNTDSCCSHDFHCPVFLEICSYSTWHVPVTIFSSFAELTCWPLFSCSKCKVRNG